MTKRKPRIVLCVGNLNKNCLSDDLSNFVKSLTVEVFSCFKVVPRHRYGTDPDEDRAAFRLCIALADIERLLDSTVWPE
jgi:hypothetical protein